MRFPIAALVFFLSLTLPGFFSWAQGNGIPGGDEFLEGRRLQESDQWAASIEPLRKAAEVYSLVADYALYQIAMSAVKMGDTGMATYSLERLLAIYPETPICRTAQLDLARLYCDTGKPASAAHLIQAALPGAESSREAVSLMLMLAKAYSKTDASKSDSVSWQLVHGWSSTAEALDAVSLIRTVDTPEKRLAIAKVYYQNKKTKEALGILDGLISDPDAASLMPEALLYKAQSLALEGQKQAALGLYNRIIDNYANSSSASTALFNRAEYMRKLKLSDEALADYARLVESFPDSDLAPKALRQRAKIFEKMDDPREYVEYEKILEKYKNSDSAYSGVMYGGVKLFRTGDYARARGFFQKLLSANLSADANADAVFWSAKCLAAEGKTDSAREKLTEIIRSFGDSYQAFRARAMLQCANGAQAMYSQTHSVGWQELFSYDQNPFVSYEVATSEDAFSLVERELPAWRQRSLQRLRFFMLNHLSEAKPELEYISQDAQKPQTKYAMAWALFHEQAYYDSLRIAASLREKFSKPPGSVRIMYLMYPVAYPELLTTSALRYDMDPLLSLAVMREESHFFEDSVSVSDACGLMQILPQTGKWLASKMFSDAAFERSDLFLPSVNIELGNYYLRYLLDKFDNNLVLALAAYNWGETNLRNWLNVSEQNDFDVLVESIPADEPRRYVKKVLRSYLIYRSLYPADFLANSGVPYSAS